MPKVAVLVLLAAALAVSPVAPRGQRVDDKGKTRLLPDGSTIMGKGKRVVLDSRPVDAAASTDGRWILVKDNVGVKVVDPEALKVVASWNSNDGMSAVGIDVAENIVWVTTANRFLIGLWIGTRGSLEESQRIDLGDSYPNGIVCRGSTAYVALSTKNQIAEVDLSTAKLKRTLDVGVAPFSVALAGNKLVVAEQGGPGHESGLTATSAGSEVAVDERGIAKYGAVGVIDLVAWRVERQLKVGTLPTGLLVEGNGKVLVACANTDTVEEIDPSMPGDSRIVRAFPRGSAPSGLAQAGDEILVTLAGQNKVEHLTSHSEGWGPIAQSPTDWFPVALVRARDKWFSVNTKGMGSRTQRAASGRNSYDYRGSLRVLERSSLGRAFIPESKSGGSPAIKHVVYVIKENRTYDQVLGDMKEGDGDPKLCTFGEQITPNQHALAKEWVLLDNYYCSGVLSADGHSWATEGNSTPYLERSFGGFKRSYTFGDDPLTYSNTGFVWDGLIDKGLTVRNYGEFDYAQPVEKTKDIDLYRASLAGKVIPMKSSIGVKRMRELACPGYPGWNLAISDQYRVDRYIEDLDKMTKAGSMPNLSVVYLPQDHTGGPVSPASHVADNDLAVGRLVEALSQSPFWKDTVVFVNEDDPQAGTDHIDGHRSMCLVIGPYVKRRAVSSRFYCQASVIHTIDKIFGIEARNIKTSMTPVFDDLFASTPNLTPYVAKQPLPLLTETVSSSKYRGLISKLALKRQEVQTPSQMDTLNRAIWESMKPGTRYPREWAGAHGRGLASKGLKGVADDD